MSTTHEHQALLQTTDYRLQTGTGIILVIVWFKVRSDGVAGSGYDVSCGKVCVAEHVYNSISTKSASQ